MSIFRLYLGLNISFDYNTVRKNLFRCAFFCWDSKPSLREMDQKFNFGGTIGYGNSYLELLFRHFKVFKLQAKLHDAVGAVRAQSGKGLGYCYMIGRGPNSCLLGQVTGLLSCHNVKLFLPSIFYFQLCRLLKQYVLHCTRYWVGRENTIQELGVFLDGKVQGYSFRPPKKYKPTKWAFWSTRNLHGFVLNSGCLDYSELSNILRRAANGE